MAHMRDVASKRTDVTSIMAKCVAEGYPCKLLTDRGGEYCMLQAYAASGPGPSPPSPAGATLFTINHSRLAVSNHDGLRGCPTWISA